MKGWLMPLLAVVLLSGCIRTEQTAPQLPPAAPKLELRSELVGCSFDSFPAEANGRFEFFFKIWVVGELPTDASGLVCLKPGKDNNPHCLSLNRAYQPSQVLWGEIQWSEGRRGQEWFFDTKDGQRIDQDYTLYYTLNKYKPEEGALELYHGSTEYCRTVTH